MTLSKFIAQLTYQILLFKNKKYYKVNFYTKNSKLRKVKKKLKDSEKISIVTFDTLKHMQIHILRVYSGYF